MKRPICPLCRQKPVAINYIKNGKTYYRRICDSCIRLGRKYKAPEPNWLKAGYKKKMICDRCGFNAKWPGQILVYYVDGNLKNTNLRNLRSVCLNCSVDIEKQDLPWQRNSGLEADN